MPVKVQVFGAAPFSVQEVCNVQGVMVSSWVFPQNKIEGFQDYAPAADILLWFQLKLSGAGIPLEKLANVQSKTRYGGMENSGCIFYFEESVNGKQDQRALFAHEIAHQWFGNCVSEKDWPHIWLSEGFATYLTMVYERETFGEEQYMRSIESARKRVLKFEKQNPKRAILDSLSDVNDYLSPLTYQKAALFLNALHSHLGDEMFWEILRQYIQKFWLSNADTKDFIEIAERVSGRELDVWMTRWLLQPGVPELRWKYRFDSENQKIEFEFRQEAEQWKPQVVDVAWKESGGLAVQKRVWLNAAGTLINLPAKHTPYEVALENRGCDFFRKVSYIGQ
jgi:aminopeptidase N